MKAFFTYLIGAILASGAIAANGQEATSRSISVNIAQQPLTDALNAWADQTGFQVICLAPDVARALTAPSVQGSFTPKGALDRLLTGTPLEYEFVNERAVTIRGPKGEGTAKLEETANEALSHPGAAGGGMRLVQNESPAAGDGRRAEDQGSEPSKEGSDTKLEEIVVTAQRREERLLDTPISIGVLSGEALDRSSSRGVADVLGQVGGVSVIETAPGGQRIAVRGVLAGAGTSTTGFYLDEVPFMSPRGDGLPDANAFDLARVEVLRGPQGTLYGAAALGGVVRVLTNDANLDDFGIKGRTRASSTDGGGGNYSGDLAVNVPLIPGKLAIRGVASYSELSGYIDATDVSGLPPIPERRINDTEAEAYRLKVNYAATDQLSFKLGLSSSRIHNDAPSEALDDFTTPLSGDSPQDIGYDVYNLTAEYKWSDVSLLSSTSYIDYAGLGQGNLVLLGAVRRIASNQFLKSFSQEFRLASNLEGPWQWSAGAIYRDDTDKVHQEVFNFILPPIFVGTPGINTEQSESYAAFGEVTRSFNDGRFDLTAGLRYFHDDYTTTQQSLFNGSVPAPGTTRSFSKTTGRIVLAYKPQENSTFYGSVATGFRSGQNQTSAVVSVSPDYPPTDPDSLITYELGAKGQLFGGALTYETAVYYMDWEDIQQSLITPENFSARLNAGSASGAGVEATLGYQPIPALLLQASVGWNDLRLDEDVHSFPRSGGVPVDVTLFRTGDRVNNSPEWTGSIGGSYRMATPMTNVDFLLSTNFAYGSQRLQRSLSGTTLNQTYSDNLRTLKASAGLEGDRWSVDIYGDNLLNDDGSVTPPSPGQSFTSVRQRPRTIGLQVTFNF